MTASLVKKGLPRRSAFRLRSDLLSPLGLHMSSNPRNQLSSCAWTACECGCSGCSRQPGQPGLCYSILLFNQKTWWAATWQAFFTDGTLHGGLRLECHKANAIYGRGCCEKRALGRHRSTHCLLVRSALQPCRLWSLPATLCIPKREGQVEHVDQEGIAGAAQANLTSIGFQTWKVELSCFRASARGLHVPRLWRVTSSCCWQSCGQHLLTIARCMQGHAGLRLACHKAACAPLGVCQTRASHALTSFRGDWMGEVGRARGTASI